MWKEPIELTRAIRRWARGDEDLAQDMRLAAWCASKQPHIDQSKATGYMVRAAHYTKVHALRDSSRQKRNVACTVLSGEMDEGPFAPQTQPVETWSPLMTLVPESFLRRVLDGAELEELGATEGVKGSTIWLRHKRTCDKLRLELEP